VRSVGEALFGPPTLVDAEGVYVRACSAIEEQLRACEAAYEQMIERWSDADLPEARDALALITEITSWVTIARQGIVSFDAPLRVVLLGRTQAGKSSLFCSLTGGDRERIGEGGQATTRATTRLPMRTEPGIEVSDTPGVGALDRPVDRVVALEEARRADLVVWLCTDDSFQAEEADALEEVLSWGVPVVLALHCFVDLSSPSRLRRFLRHRDSQPRQVLERSPEGGHLARPLRAFRRRGQSPAAVIPFHAGAALAADDDPELAVDLLDASNLDQLIGFLLGQLNHERDLRRTSAAIDSCRQTLDEGKLRSALACHEAARLHMLGVKSRADMERRSALLLDSALASIQDVAQTRIASFDAWADEHYRKDTPKQVVAALNTDLGVAVAALEKEMVRRADKLQRDLTALGASVSAEWASLDAQTRDVGTAWHRKLPSRWRKGVAGGVISVAALAVTALGHPWAGAAMVAVGDVLLDKIPWVGGRKAALTQRRTDLQREVSARCDAAMAEMLTQWTTTVDGPLRESVSSYLESRRLANGAVSELRDQFGALAHVFNAAVVELDSVLIGALLELEGHSDLTESVTKVRRVPGAECAITLDHPPRLTAMRMHPHLRGAAFLSAEPEPPLAVLTRLLGRRATRGWRAVPSHRSSSDGPLLLVIPPSAQLAEEARRLADFATYALDLHVEARTTPPRSHDNDEIGVPL